MTSHVLLSLLATAICYRAVDSVIVDFPAVESVDVGENSSSVVKLRMTSARPEKNGEFKDDLYSITTFNLTGVDDLYISRYTSVLNGNLSTNFHYATLNGCQETDCVDSTYLFVWSRNAPSLTLPPSVRFRIGRYSPIKYLRLAIYYQDFIPFDQEDIGVDIDVERHKPKYIAGTYALFGTASPSELKKEKHVNLCCKCKQLGPVRLFGFYADPYELGGDVIAYKIDKQETIEELGRGNSKWPQAYYALNQTVNLEPGDTLKALCKSGEQIKNDGREKMCLFFILYFTESNNNLFFDVCDKDKCYVNDKDLLPDDDESVRPHYVFLQDHSLFNGGGQYEIRTQDLIIPGIIFFFSLLLATAFIIMSWKQKNGDWARKDQRKVSNQIHLWNHLHWRTSPTRHGYRRISCPSY